MPPSDEITGVGVLGTVTNSSGGPCYVLRADDGRVLAMYSSTASFDAGQRIRARLVTPAEALYCGAAEAMRLLDSKPAA